MNPDEFHAIRREYIQKALNESDAPNNPFELFDLWFKEAMDKVIDLANAMTLSTVDSQGEPNSRVVLLKGFDEHGLTFFSNYQSAKAKDLENHAKASLLFHWSLFDRQIRIKGTVEKVSEEESRAYFQSRPLDSQIAASISEQSQSVPNREFLEQAFDNKKAELGQNQSELELPDFWGGYRVKPSYFEFWQGRENRLHDRLAYTLDQSNWNLDRLAP